MYESPFSYNITRPYPYRWFTWLAIIGGIVMTALFSVINLAATGYESSVLYTSNPNQTEHPEKPAWFQQKPWSLATKVSSTCQSQTILKGSRFYTTNLGFSYKIVGLYSGEGGQQNPIESFTYHNSHLNCRFVTLSLSPINGRFIALDASASINCTVYDNSVPVTMILSLDLHFDTTSQLQSNDTEILLKMNSHTQPSLYWGQRMLAYSYETLSVAYITRRDGVKLSDAVWQFYPANSNDSLPKGSISSSRPEEMFVTSRLTFETSTNNKTDSPRMCAGCTKGFSLTERQWTSTTGLELASQPWISCGVVETESHNGCSDPAAPFMKQGIPTEGLDCVKAEPKMSIPCNITSMSYVRAGIAMEGLAVLFVSTILTDLGQLKDYNIFFSPEQAMRTINQTFLFLRNTRQQSTSFKGDYIGVSKRIQYWNDWKPPNDPIEFFRWLDTEVPQVKNTVITTRYLCQTPKLKSPGSLIVSVVVADLVLLQALWRILNWIVAFHLERRHPDATHCSGCVGVCAGRMASEAGTRSMQMVEKPVPTRISRLTSKDDYSHIPDDILGRRVSLQIDLRPSSEVDTLSISDMDEDLDHTNEMRHPLRGSSQPLLLSPQP